MGDKIVGDNDEPKGSNLINCTGGQASGFVCTSGVMG